MAYDNKPGATFTQNTTISPEIMNLLQRFYLTQVDVLMKTAKTETRTVSLAELYAVTSGFWGSMRMKVPDTDGRKNRLDAFFYGDTNEVDYNKADDLEKVRSTFDSRQQAIIVLRDVWHVAGKYGITMDFSFILEGYENFGRGE